MWRGEDSHMYICVREMILFNQHFSFSDDSGIANPKMFSATWGIQTIELDFGLVCRLFNVISYIYIYIYEDSLDIVLLGD